MGAGHPGPAHHHFGQRHLRAARKDLTSVRTRSQCLRFRIWLPMKAASTREGWMSGPSHPPLAPAKAFSRSSCGRIFSLYSRVIRVGRSTDLCARKLNAVSPGRYSPDLMTAPIWCSGTNNLLLNGSFRRFHGRLDMRPVRGNGSVIQLIAIKLKGEPPRFALCEGRVVPTYLPAFKLHATGQCHRTESGPYDFSSALTDQTKNRSASITT